MSKNHFATYDPRHFKPRRTDEEEWPMVQHAIVLLKWASENRENAASITIIARETNIPRMSLAWLLKDYRVRGCDSIVSRVARSFSYDFIIYKTWNTRDKYKRKKKIIDAVKISDPDFEKDR